MMANHNRRALRPSPTETSGVGEPRGRTSRKKNTRRWCRGKPGVEHQPKCVPYEAALPSPMSDAWRKLVCTGCGKKLAVYYPIRLVKVDGSVAREPKPPPPWVDC